jgi:hypothetical protein
LRRVEKLEPISVPVTPFHFGPGGFIAVASRRTISFLAFVAVNILIDVESLYHLLTHQPRIHTFLHTYVGASIAAAAIVLAFIPARRLAMRMPESAFVAWRSLSIAAVCAGAFVGAWSHVFLDSIMHADIRPWAPFSPANGLYRAVSLPMLHLACAATGAIALAWWWWSWWRSSSDDAA